METYYDLVDEITRTHGSFNCGYVPSFGNRWSKYDYSKLGKYEQATDKLYAQTTRGNMKEESNG